MGEVHGDERGSAGVHADGFEPASLVDLRVRMIELEEAHPGRAEAQSAIVVAGAHDHHLVDTAGDRVERRLVEKRGAREQVRTQPHRFARLHAAGEPPLSVGIAVRRDRTIELRAHGGHALGGAGPALFTAQPEPHGPMLERHERQVILVCQPSECLPNRQFICYW